MFLVSGDYRVQYRYRGLCPGRQDLANNHINPVIRSANLIVAPSHQPSLLNHLLSFSSCFRVWELNPHSEHFDLSRHAWQTFSLSRISGIYSKTFSIAFVMGISSAQAILRNVQEDSIDSSGMYAIVDSPPFSSSATRLSTKVRRGWGLYSSRRFIRLNHASGTLGNIFQVKFGNDNDCGKVEWLVAG